MGENESNNFQKQNDFWGDWELARLLTAAINKIEVGDHDLDKVEILPADTLQLVYLLALVFLVIAEYF